MSQVPSQVSLNKCNAGLVIYSKKLSTFFHYILKTIFTEFKNWFLLF